MANTNVNVKLLQQVEFLMTDDKNLPILEKLLEIHTVSLDFLHKLKYRETDNNENIVKFIEKLILKREPRVGDDSDSEYEYCACGEIEANKVKRKCEDLEKQLEECNTKKELFKSQIVNLQQQLENCTVKCLEVVKERDEYLEARQSLINENKDLTEERDLLIDENKDLTEERDEFVTQRNNLKNQVSELTIQLNKIAQKDDPNYMSEAYLNTCCNALAALRERPFKFPVDAAVLIALSTPICDVFNDISKLSNEYLNKILMSVWCCFQHELFKKIIVAEHFVFSPNVLEEMIKSFRYIIENKIRLSEQNTIILLESYMKNNRTLSITTINNYCKTVGFDKFNKIISDYYAKVASEEISKLV